MVETQRPARARWRRPCAAMGALLSLLAGAAPAGAQTPFELYRERAAMLAAGGRCRLFDAELTAALTAGKAQARTAALRTGLTDDALDRGGASAEAIVATLSCQSPRMQQSAQRAKAAYGAYSGLKRMAFPGEIGAWRADRIMPLKSAAWRLAQDAWAGEDKVVFGLAGEDGVEAITLAVASVDAAPYAARLVLRDVVHAPRPYLAGPGAPLSARAPVRAAARVILASARAPADRALRPLGARMATAFRFPPETEAALSRLDPREAVSIELLYSAPGGEIVRTAFVEVGDFDAGLAFLSSGPR